MHLNVCLAGHSAINNGVAHKKRVLVTNTHKDTVNSRFVHYLFDKVPFRSAKKNIQPCSFNNGFLLFFALFLYLFWFFSVIFCSGLLWSNSWISILLSMFIVCTWAKRVFFISLFCTRLSIVLFKKKSFALLSWKDIF